MKYTMFILFMLSGCAPLLEDGPECEKILRDEIEEELNVSISFKM